MTNGNADLETSIGRLNRVGLLSVAILFFGIGGWLAIAPLSGAVIAPGFVVVDSNTKKVQHPTGGIVAEIMIKEGSQVRAGQVIMRLDDTVTRATLGVVQTQLSETLAREARLRAERDDQEVISFPAELTNRQADNGVANAIAGEIKLFDNRRNTRNGQKQQLRERIAQLQQEIRGLTAQINGKDNEIKFITEELVGVTELYNKNLIPIVRYMQLQRDKARVEGDHGNLTAELARSHGKISEIEIQLLQIDQDLRTEVSKDLREAEGKIAELRERYTAAEDQLKRVDIRAPQDGYVHQLSVHTIGGVIANGETIMLIVPDADQLVIEAKVAPQDVDQLSVGAKANIRIMAGNQRITPDLQGELIRVSADLTREQQTNQTYYVIRASLAPDQLKKLGDLKLLPGMPAEAFIQTQERTPLQYLMKPLRDQIARTFRER